MVYLEMYSAPEHDSGCDFVMKRNCCFAAKQSLRLSPHWHIASMKRNSILLSRVQWFHRMRAIMGRFLQSLGACSAVCYYICTAPAPWQL